MIGLIHHKKTFKNVVFYLFDTVHQRYQLTFKENRAELKNYSYIKLIDYVVASKSIKHQQIEVKKYELISEPVETVPFELDKITSVKRNVVHKHRGFSLRSLNCKQIFYTKHLIKQQLIETANKLDFISIESPKIISEGLETGGAQMFKLNYYNKIMYLTQSPQMFKQIMVNVFDKVYQSSVIFRAEKSDSPKHLAEINVFDIQMVTDKLRDLIDLIKLMILNAGNKIGYKFSNKDFAVYQFRDLKSKLINSELEEDLCTSELNELSNTIHDMPEWYFVTHYPSSIRPFYTKNEQSFDLYYKDIEIASGSLRVYDYKQLVDKLTGLNMDVKAFENYLENFKYGSKPHGGFSIGVDRLTMIFTGLPNVLDVVMYPRSYTNISG